MEIVNVVRVYASPTANGSPNTLNNSQWKYTTPNQSPNLNSSSGYLSSTSIQSPNTSMSSGSLNLNNVSDTAVETEVMSINNITGVPNQPEIATLVFFDLETTGLPQYPKDPNVQVTEISLIAVSKKDFEFSDNPDLKDVRVMNKLSLCVKPRCYIHPMAAKITGLNSVNLKNQGQFDDFTSHMIDNFLSRLPQPVCLLAHNGNSFDYPLLKAELKRFSYQLPANLLTADTLLGFRAIDLYSVNENDPQSPVKKKQRTPKSPRVSYKLESIHQHFFRRKQKNRHSSEGDCMSLMMVCHKLKHKIMPWIENNKRLLQTIEPMW